MIITMVFKLISALALVTGCNANRLPDYSPLSAHQYSITSTQKNLTVAIYLMMDGVEVEKYFGTNLLS